jgi:hypothetical protein
MKDASSSVASGKRFAPKAANDNLGKKVTATLTFPSVITVVEVEVFASLLDRVGLAANDNG